MRITRFIVPLKSIEYGVYGDRYWAIPQSIYLSGTVRGAIRIPKDIGA